MKNHLFTLALIIISQGTLGSTIFKCQLPITPFDPDFQQGQELYLDVLWQEQSPKVLLYRSFGPKVEVNKEVAIRRFGFTNSHSSFLVSWEGRESYLSMVYLGGETWGAYLKYENPLQGLPVQSEFMCKEATDVTQL